MKQKERKCVICGGTLSQSNSDDRCFNHYLPADWDPKRNESQARERIYKRTGVLIPEDPCSLNKFYLPLPITNIKEETIVWDGVKYPTLVISN